MRESSSHTNFTWPAKSCPCGDVMDSDCQKHGCLWQNNPEQVPQHFRIPVDEVQQEFERWASNNGIEIYGEWEGQTYISSVERYSYDIDRRAAATRQALKLFKLRKAELGAIYNYIAHALIDLQGNDVSGCKFRLKILLEDLEKAKESVVQ